MSTYFVTGATGFLGSQLVARLLARETCDRVYVLVRPASQDKLERIADRWPRRELVMPVLGDLAEDGLGLGAADLLRLSDGVDHLLHLGAVYDLTASEEHNTEVNVDGTRRVVELAEQLGVRWLHHVSSVAVAGEHRGVFTEEDFDLGQHFASPYHATKFAAEQIVRSQHAVPWRIYRPAVVVGDSRTGEIDKIDGPYFFFPTFARLAKLPRQLPLVGADIGATNVVPVDFVADAIDHLAHAAHPPGRTFHLTSPRPQPVTEVYNAFAAAAGAPTMAFSLPHTASTPLRALSDRGLRALSRTAERVPGSTLLFEWLGVPAAALPHLTLTATFDSGATQGALAGSGLRVPELREYADTLWRYWSDHLDPDRARRPRSGGELGGRTVMVTGASSGIGRATALEVARHGGIPLLVARRAEELAEVRAEIIAAGGTAYAYPCDLTDPEAVRAMLKDVLTQHEAVDMLVNNAGRSIRRSLLRSTDRQHDFERTMAINYHAPVRLILGLLPHMTRRRFGHIVNISTQGTQVGTPRFAAYLASKAALDAFTRVASAEAHGNGITFTTVHMPLVRTPMIEPTKVYRRLPAASPQRAAELVITALTRRPTRVTLPLGTAFATAYALAPKAVDRVMSLVYRLGAV
ncbi:SDR family oxidoreductase [Crossiella cryophila]|uniref:Thioester reductase-like protein/short-subunit dehydrogenase involved in D-alanine esterification of teichoic acids n=1 Tax=Crossiella cryophila TaxID=43355 RepID=A0A7W7CAK5_9PSEU|nr:SDR family oxidoreductase [Crossiella cryophila]MBB4676159.1 thioester reductase-like protein/short-subunit dehydrogenase involved in D-alanine esterification of teichoic acids [Crossiella cryophila]